MIRSMTGFGEAERHLDDGLLRVEIKTVNHRFFNANVRTPQGFDRYEHKIQGWLKERLSRGHVTYSLSLDRSGPGALTRDVAVDVERARGYLAALETLREELRLPGEVDLSMLSRFGELFRAPDPEPAAGVTEEELRAVTLEATGVVVAMREAEGAKLRADMEERLDAAERSLEEVAALAPARLLAERDRLREAVRVLTEAQEVDEDRLAREVAYLADRWDVNEEIVRFKAHVAAYRKALDTDAAEPVGKRLGFLVQEMHREANTIGSKANDAGISRAAVRIKEEIERLREQVENVE